MATMRLLLRAIRFPFENSQPLNRNVTGSEFASVVVFAKKRKADGTISPNLRPSHVKSSNQLDSFARLLSLSTTCLPSLIFLSPDTVFSLRGRDCLRVSFCYDADFEQITILYVFKHKTAFSRLIICGLEMQSDCQSHK